MINGGIVTTLAGGTIGYMDGSGSVAKFGLVNQIAISNGAIFVSDRSNFRIRQIACTSGFYLSGGFCYAPTSQPSNQPSRQPSCKPSSQPSRQPISPPTSQPSSHPSRNPTSQPSCQPR